MAGLLTVYKHQWHALQVEDMRDSFLPVGDLNGHHQELLSFTTTNRNGGAEFDFATVSGCDQLVVGPDHARGGTLDHRTTDVLKLVRFPSAAQITTVC